MTYKITSEGGSEAQLKINQSYQKPRVNIFELSQQKFFFKGNVTPKVIHTFFGTKLYLLFLYFHY